MGINPLQIPKILEQVLEYLDIHHLKSSRLVNSSWNIAAISILKNVDMIHLNSIVDIKRFLLSYQCPINKLSFPYQKCILGSSLLDSEDSDFIGFNKIALQFFESFGEYLTDFHLSLRNYSTPTSELLWELLDKRLHNLITLSILVKGPGPEPVGAEEILTFPLVKTNIIKLPKIRHFYINFSGYQPKTDLKAIISGFIQSFINLETISCKVQKSKGFQKDNRNSITPYFLQENNRTLHNAIFEILVISEYSLKYLSKIEVLLKLNDGQLQLISNFLSDCNLQNIYFDLDNSVQSLTLSKFLFNQQNSLEHIYLEFPPVCSRITKLFNEIDFQCQMRKLITIYLVNYNESLDFLRFCPELKSLVVILPNTIPKSKANNIFNNLRHATVNKISSFKINFKNNTNGDHEKIVWSLISERFQHLMALHLENVNNGTIKSVFASLTNLRRLNLTGKSISDSGICGESDKMLRILLESALESENGLKQSPWDFQPRFPNIGNLKHLQFLSIEADLITDACLLFGISRSIHLKTLIINPKLELITNFGFQTCSSLKDLEVLQIYVRNHGHSTLKDLVAFK